MKLSGKGWTLRLDREAEWQDDELFLPPVNISDIPENPPTCGWNNLQFAHGKDVSVPGTVEEHYWGENGNPLGVAGDYRGVSWWSRKFSLDPVLKGKRIILAFDSANLRAEIYVNRKLTGYDVVANTPFEADITDAVAFGRENTLDIRITDPVGNFSWPAHITFPWGKYNIPAVRGFGGITGDVTLRAVDTVYIEDIYVSNRKEITEVEVFTTLNNSSVSEIEGNLSLVIYERGNPSNILWEKTVPESFPPGIKELSMYVKAPAAKKWDILDPNLYVASVRFTSSDNANMDSMERRFGFRWFDIGEKDGDQRLYLNGKRIFIRGCKNRTFWPTNGMYASPEWAKKDVELVIEMGYNTIKVTNAISPVNHVKYCDELGVLYTSRSSGYRINGADGKPIRDEFTRALRRENLMRFVKRDRSCPSLFFWSLKGEDPNPPDEDDFKNMETVRALDNTRVYVYNGGRDRTKKAPYINDPDSPAKTFYKPLDPTPYTHGWWDMHHWGHAGYRDEYYMNPQNYLRLNILDGDPTYQVLKDEVLYYGEEGSFGSMARLGKIKEQIDMQGSSDGWREKEFLDWYESYDRFLDEAGFRTSFPSVDHLTKALGENLFYFHGRTLENCRVSNIIDAYIVNGAASGATHTDMFDIYRNPVADPSILAYYSQPLYLAVKLREKVLPVGAEPVADIFIVNEQNLKGRQTLELELYDPDGEIVFSKLYRISISGGEEYGQLLVEGVRLPALAKHGYYSLKARISGKTDAVCTGFDNVYAVDFMTGNGLKGRGAVIDTSGAVNNLLSKARGISLPDYENDRAKYDYIVIGAHDFDLIRGTVYRSIMEQVLSGATLVVLDSAEDWAEQWDDVYWYQSVQYNGSSRWGNRGRLFLGDSTILTGLPVSQAMGWEYQVFYGGNVRGLDIGHIGNETVVALAAEHRSDILTAVAKIPFGTGRIIVSTLDMLPNLDSELSQSSIAKKLFLNFLEYPDK
ncbi:glycoside hydrolase family 2 protein [Candidatus Latescibacterota bacterium]